jgi:ABC-type antimicrobial peptide transport system permease subunit
VATSIAPEARNLLGTDLDSLFDDAQDRVAPASGGTNLAATEDRLAQTSGRDALNRTLDGVWNFVLLKAKTPGDLGWTGDLQRTLDRAGLNLQVRDWVGTAGGNALVVSLLQVLFSVGLGLVALVSALIVMNSLALSVVERTQEIGTWRALGASRPRVASVIALETGLLILASALVGLAAASAVLVALSGRGIPLHNPFLASLLGTDRLRPSFTLGLWAGHLALSLVLALAACWLPIRRALAISPLKAMQSEASS